MDKLTTISDMMPQCIIGSVSLQLLDSAKVQLPKTSSMEGSHRNKRVDSIAACQKYERNTFIFPDLTKNLPSGESYVLYDSIRVNPRFIIFGTPASLAALTSCAHIVMDCTFKSSPSTFFPTVHPSRFMRGYYFTVPDVFVTIQTAKNVHSTLLGNKNALPRFRPCDNHYRLRDCSNKSSK